MEKKNSTFKRFNRTFKLLWSCSKSFVFIGSIYYLLMALIPYVNIYCGALLLDGLIVGAEKNYLYTVVFYMIGLDLVLGIICSVLKHYYDIGRAKIDYLVQKKISEKIFSLSYEQIEDNDNMKKLEFAKEGCNGSGNVGTFMDNVGQIIGGVSNIIYSIVLLVSLFKVVDTSDTSAIVTFLNNPWNSLIIFAVVAIVIIVSIIDIKISNKASYNAMIENMAANRAYSYFFDLCGNYKYGKDIRIFRMQKMISDQLYNNKHNVNEGWLTFVNIDIKANTLDAFVYACLLAVSYIFVGLKAIYGLISVGNVIAYVSSITLLVTGLSTIVGRLGYINLMTNYLEKYFEYIDIKSTCQFGTKELDSNEPISVEFKNVTFTYPHQDKKTLDDVCFKINKNSSVALVGQNGAGKTTAIKLLCRFYEPDSGEILVNDIPIKEYSKESCYKLFSIVFQDFKLFSFTVKDNVSCTFDGDKDKVLNALESAGVKDRVLSFKDGIDTIMYNKNDESGVEFSGGEAQKIAIARALYKDSPLVILDEPTSALDPKSEAEIYSKFSNLVKDKTSLFVSHRMSSCRFCDDIIVFEDGKVVQEGDHKKLVKNKDGLYYKMWEAQAKYYL